MKFGSFKIIKIEYSLKLFAMLMADGGARIAIITWSGNRTRFDSRLLTQYFVRFYDYHFMISYAVMKIGESSVKLKEILGLVLQTDEDRDIYRFSVTFLLLFSP